MKRLSRASAAAPFLIPGLAMVLFLGLAAKETGRRPVRVLILSGQNNHDWKTTTPKLKAILEETGRFVVDVTEKPASLTPRSLRPYDAILSNWNSFGFGPEREAWPEDARRAYLDFVRQGKGHIVVHAGSASFFDWKEYGRLVMGSYIPGQTGHGPRHEFPVRIDDADHPVTAGLEPFRIFDELWNRPGVAENATTLASAYSAPAMEGTDRWEPTALAGRFGQGRSFALMLGHDATAMDNPGFQALLRRGVEWAATGRVEGVATGAAARRPGERTAWRWEKEDGKSLALAGSSGILWRFRYDPALAAAYFHPLNTVDGRTLTWDEPPDHVWHHGLWFSWKFVNTVNYWEIDPKTGRPPGKTSWRGVRIRTKGNGSAAIRMELAYAAEGTEDAVLTEKRSISVGPPDASGVYAIDWTGVFTAVRRVVLDRTPLPGEPGGQTWGGYSGLSVRLAEGLADRQAVSADGPVVEMTDDRYRGRHWALDYSGLVGGTPAGIAVLDHAKNPGSPTPWYVIRSAEMSFFTPAVICYGPMTLEPGRKMTLRYRVIVHPGRWDPERLQNESDRFAGRKRQNQ